MAAFSGPAANTDASLSWCINAEMSLAPPEYRADCLFFDREGLLLGDVSGSGTTTSGRSLKHRLSFDSTDSEGDFGFIGEERVMDSERLLDILWCFFFGLDDREWQSKNELPSDSRCS